MEKAWFKTPKYRRTKTKKLVYQNVQIGHQNRVVIQSMTTTKTHDVAQTIKQIKSLQKLGCELIRVTCFDNQDADALSEIVRLSPLPVVVDIHFNYLFALKAIEAGCAGIRINPGNISNQSELIQILDQAKKHKTNIRIGINSGSLPKHIIEQYGHSALGMFEAMKEFISFFEQHHFYNIVMSVKSTDPLVTLAANQMLANHFKYPIHLGVTEAGTVVDASIKSSVGLAPLLLSGIGDTIRISITGDPKQEIPVALKLLQATNLNKNSVNVISCPTCGRLDFQMEPLVKKTIQYTKHLKIPLTISILGCVVNGIGEGLTADIGIAGSKDKGILFVKGKIVKQCPGDQLWDELKKAIDNHVLQWQKDNKD